MSTMPYDPQALTKFVESTDHFGLYKITPPPKTLLEGDMVRREPNAPAQWLGAVVTLAGSSMLAGLIVVAVIVAQSGPAILQDPTIGQRMAQAFMPGTQSSVSWTIAALLGNAFFATVIYWVWVRLAAKRPVYELTGEGWLAEFGTGLLIGALMISAVVGTLFFMGYYTVDGVQFTPQILLALCIGIGPAFAEEVVFRGFALRLLSKTTGSWLALVITSLIFGLMHASNPHVTLLQSILLGLSAGLLLGAAYFVTRRLWLPIGIHLTWNFLQGGIYNSDVSGTGFSGGLLKGTFNGPEFWTGGKMGVEGSIVSIGLTIALAVVFVIIAYRRGHMNPRVGGNAPRLDLNGRVPRIEIWSADGHWRVLPTPEELYELMTPVDLEPEGPRVAPIDEAAALVTNEDPALADLDAPLAGPMGDTDQDPFEAHDALEHTLYADDPQAVTGLGTLDDTGSTGADVTVAGAVEMTADLTDQLPDLSPTNTLVEEGLDTEAALNLDPDGLSTVAMDSQALAEMDQPESTVHTMGDDQAVSMVSDVPLPPVSLDDEINDHTQPIPMPRPSNEPPVITKVSSAVTAVTGTGTGQITDEDLDATQQMDTITLGEPMIDGGEDDDPKRVL